MKARIKSKSNTFNVLWNYIKIVVNRKKKPFRKETNQFGQSQRIKANG
jgi:hypothetical protein